MSSDMKSSYRYFDINSEFRDRNSYPNQCDFVIPISQSSQVIDGVSAKSPVSLAIPYESGNTVAVDVAGLSVTLSATSSAIDNFYSGSYLELSNDATVGVIPRQFAKITSYVGSTKVASLVFSPTPTSGNVQFYTIRKTAPILQGLVGASTTSTITLPATASNVTDYYKGFFIGFVNDATQVPTAGLRGLSRLVTAYNGTTRVATVLPFPIAPVAATDTFDIDAFSYDSYAPLKYSGTGNFSQPVCYELKLESLLIPNQLLNNSNTNSAGNIGGRLNYYPYIYVSFYCNTSKSTDQSIYSNNPNSSNVVFKVPIVYNLDPYVDSLPFYVLSDLSPKTIKFKPNENLRFTITLPNGNVIAYATADNQSPLFANPLLQVSAFISAKRID